MISNLRKAFAAAAACSALLVVGGCGDEADAAPAGGYKAGTYSADGAYTNPAGPSSIGVQVTLESDGVITAVQVTPQSSTEPSRTFQGIFAEAVKPEVVGKKIDELSVSKVAGSSLTSGGFNAAIEQIKAEATA